MVSFGMMSPTVAIILLVIVLLIFGPGKLPQAVKGLGKSIKDFKQEMNTVDAEIISEEKNVQDGTGKDA